MALSCPVCGSDLTVSGTCWHCGWEHHEPPQPPGEPPPTPRRWPRERAIRFTRWFVLANWLMWVCAAILPAHRVTFQLFVLPNLAVLIIAYAWLAGSRIGITYGVFNLVTGPVMCILAWWAPQLSRLYAAGVALILLPVMVWLCWMTRTKANSG